MRLFIIRHGETAWALTGQHTSRTDLPLTEHGRAMAATLPPRLAQYSFAQVLSSPRLRARQTAELAGFPHAEVCEDLREFDYGEYEGLTKPQIQARMPGWNIFKDGCPGGETLAQVAARAQNVADGGRHAGVHARAPRAHPCVLLAPPAADFRRATRPRHRDD
jgi:probable phosphoglycerate mutase